MKKTTLLFLSTVGVLAGCYTSPEMDEKRYENLYISSSAACRQPEDTYQHKGLRSCLENRIAWDNAHKKTVEIIPNDKGLPLVVTKTTDGVMVKETRGYKNGSSESGVYADEEAYWLNPEAAAQYEDCMNSGQDKDACSVYIEEGLLAPMVDEEGNLYAVTSETETMSGQSDADGLVSVKTEEVVVSTEAAGGALPCCQPDCDYECDDECTETEEVVETTTKTPAVQQQQLTSGNAGAGLTLVMGPLNEELVISIKSANAQQTAKTQVAEEATTETKRTVTTRKIKCPKKTKVVEKVTCTEPETVDCVEEVVEVEPEVVDCVEEMEEPVIVEHVEEVSEKENLPLEEK